MLLPAFSICCPTFSIALSASLPARSAGPFCFWQPDSATSKALVTKAALTEFPNFIILYLLVAHLPGSESDRVRTPSLRDRGNKQLRCAGRVGHAHRRSIIIWSC